MVGIAAELVECIVQMALSPPPAGRTRWTTRLIGDEVDLTSATVAKVLRGNDDPTPFIWTKPAASIIHSRANARVGSHIHHRTARQDAFVETCRIGRRPFPPRLKQEE